MLVWGLYVCAVTLGGGRCPALPFDPISLVLAQRNGVEPPKKGALKPPHELGGPARLSHLGVSPNGTNWCVKLVYARLVNRPGKVSLTQSAVMLGLCVRGRGGRDRTAPVAASKARFFGAPPRFFAQEQRNGVELAVGGGGFCPGKRRTRTSPKQPPAPPPSRAKMSKDD